MSWKKYFTPTDVSSSLSPISGNMGGTSRPGPSQTNYSNYLPDVYTGSPNRIERYQQYEVMDSDPEVNAALDILAEFCTQKLKDGNGIFEEFYEGNKQKSFIGNIKNGLKDGLWKSTNLNFP